MIRIDAILRTRNRSAMLGAAVASFFDADQTGIAARLLVVDNNSTDATPELLRSLVNRHGKRLLPLHEPRAGGQHALNCALANATADVIAFFDDDERIDPRWLQEIRREFADPMTDYIAGPVRPAGDFAPPGWVPEGFGGVLGIIDCGSERRRFSPGFSAMLTQGNCAVRRRVFEEAGSYPAELPTAEDRWLNQWLEARGRQGFYCPGLVVEHVMQPERITPAYFRRWAAREGRDMAVCDKLAGRPSLLGRRWYWRQLARDTAALALPGKANPVRFRGELNLRIARSYLRAWMGYA